MAGVVTPIRYTASLPSAWVVRFRGRIRPGGETLDVACGGGRHTRYLLDRGYRVTAVDVDVSGVEDLRSHPRCEVVAADLEDGRPPPWDGRRFDGVVVTNYLHRPLLADLVAAVAPRGLLLYETFARGHERFGRPSDPRFLLRPGELLDAVRPQLRVLAYEDLVVVDPRPAALQRICAVREEPGAGGARLAA